MAFVALAGLAVSVIGGMSANKKKKKAQKKQDAAAERQAALAERAAALAEEQYKDWKSTFFPLAQESAIEARKEVRPDYDRIAADNAGAYNAQRGSMVRSAQRYGMDPTDGAFGTSLARLGADEAKTGVLARNRAREDGKGQRLRNMAAVYGMGSGMAGNATAGLSGASSQFGNIAAGYGNTAAGYAQEASNDAAGAGQAFGSIPWGQFMGGGGGGGATANGSVGPMAGGYSYQGGGGGSPGPWAGGMNYTSSREAKDNINEVDPNDALDIVNDTPVRSYNYKNSNQPMIGTIAEEAPGAISNGKQVNLLNQVGTLTGAVQALSKQMGNTASSSSRGTMGSRFMDRMVPDRNGDGRRSGGEWGRAALDGAANYATGGLYGVGRNIVNRFRGDRTRPGVTIPIPTMRDRNAGTRQTGRNAMGSTAAAVRRANAANSGPYNNANADGDRAVNNMRAAGQRAQQVIGNWKGEK